MEKKFIEAMKQVNYADSLNYNDIFKVLNLSTSQVFNNDRLFIAFDKASKKYLQGVK